MSTPKKAATRQHGKEEKQAYGVATRSKKFERFDLIPAAGLRALAIRFGLGADKHGEGNWKHGDAEFVKSLFNHCYGHLADLTSPKPQEGVPANAGAIMWAGAALAWYQENRPKLVMLAIKELREGKVG